MTSCTDCVNGGAVVTARDAPSAKTNADPQERIGAYPVLHSLPTISGPGLPRMPSRAGSRICLYQERPGDARPGYGATARRGRQRNPTATATGTGRRRRGATAKSDSDSRTRAGTVRSPAVCLLVGDGLSEDDPPDRRADLDEPFRVLRSMFTSHPWSPIPGFIPLSVAALIPQALPRSSGSAGSGCVAYLEWSSPITWPSIDSGVSSIDCR